MTLTVDELKAAHSVANDLEQLDLTLAEMCYEVEDRIEVAGESLHVNLRCGMRSVISATDVGELAFCAVVNELLGRREDLADLLRNKYSVATPAAPCKPQKPSES